MNNKVITFSKAAMFLMFGVAAIVFALGTLVNNPVKADSPTTVNNSGKYQMSTVGFLYNSKPVYNVLVWDTETGKSKIYGFNATSIKMNPETFQLPASPLY